MQKSKSRKVCDDAEEEKEQEPSDMLSVAEKRRILCQIARANLTEFMDDAGNFNAYQARRHLPGCAIQEYTVEETIRIDGDRREVLKRKVKVKLVDRVKAIKLDSALAGHRTAPTQKTDKEFEDMEKDWRLCQDEMFQQSDHIQELQKNIVDLKDELFSLRHPPAPPKAA